jgi:type IV secretory pathway VirB10-like protein
MAASNSTTPQAGSASSALEGAPSSWLIPPAARPTTPAAPPAQQQPQNRQLNPVEQAPLQAWTDYVQRKEAIDTAHYQAEVTAIGATANVNAQTGSGLQMAQAGASAPTALAAAPAPDSGASSPEVAQADGAPGGVGGWGFIRSYGGLLGGGGMFIPPANPNANDQTGKKDFLAQQGSTGSDDYLASRIQTPQSPCEVQAGTVIPATMIGGIDSDLPGEIIGQVRENVYDTATGKYLLVP